MSIVRILISDKWLNRVEIGQNVYINKRGLLTGRKKKRRIFGYICGIKGESAEVCINLNSKVKIK